MIEKLTKAIRKRMNDADVEFYRDPDEYFARRFAVLLIIFGAVCSIAIVSAIVGAVIPRLFW